MINYLIINLNYYLKKLTFIINFKKNNLIIKINK